MANWVKAFGISEKKSWFGCEWQEADPEEPRGPGGLEGVKESPASGRGRWNRLPAFENAGLVVARKRFRLRGWILS
jgi:hypothetical protein